MSLHPERSRRFARLACAAALCSALVAPALAYNTEDWLTD